MANTGKRFKKGDRVRVSEPRFVNTYGAHGRIYEVRTAEQRAEGLYQYEVKFDRRMANGTEFGVYNDDELEPS